MAQIEKVTPRVSVKGASGGKGTFRETLAGGIDRATPPGRPRKHYVELNLDWETICIEHLRAPLCPRGARRKTKDFRVMLLVGGFLVSAIVWMITDVMETVAAFLREVLFDIMNFK